MSENIRRDGLRASEPSARSIWLWRQSFHFVNTKGNPKSFSMGSNLGVIFIGETTYETGIHLLKVLDNIATLETQVL